MKIIDLIVEKQKKLSASRQPVIVCLGDSVSQGCFECYSQSGELKTVFDANESYANKLQHILRILYPSVPVNVINAGISGDKSWGGLKRLTRDVLSYQPDLVIVCYGLNDSTIGSNGLQKYVDSLKEIFETIKQNEEIEIIFMTPNLRTQAVDSSLIDPVVREAAERVAFNERENWLEKYIEAAVALCQTMEIPVCDCYKIWKQLKQKDVEINQLLSNKINHPIREMHWLFAYELVKTMLEEE